MTAFGKSHGITVEIAGCNIRLHPAFCTQNWEMIEAESYRAFAAAVRPGLVVFDIGAHIGTYTIIALKKLGPYGRVVAFEPDDLARRYLMQHLEWNDGTERTTVRGICCGSSVGIESFYYAPNQADGMNSLLPVEGFEKKEIRVTTVDAEVTKSGLAPSIIKIDVEGAEWEVLKGAELTLRQYHPSIFLSLHPAALKKIHTMPDMVLGWLGEREYHCKVIAIDHEIHVLAK